VPRVAGAVAAAWAALFWGIVESHVKGLGSSHGHDVADAVKKINEEVSPLGYEVGVELQGESDRRPTVVLTAGGIHAYVPTVLALWSMAPASLHVVAFRPPLEDAIDGSMEIRTGGGKITVGSVGFHTERTDDRRHDVTVYFPSHVLVDTDGEERVTLAFALLDHILGEYVVISKVGRVSVASVGREMAWGSLITAATLHARITADAD
jgi:hypothetical protein